jgi:hypothetical protein
MVAAATHSVSAIQLITISTTAVRALRKDMATRHITIGTIRIDEGYGQPRKIFGCLTNRRKGESRWIVKMFKGR